MDKADKIRRDMMELWKETFHDSSRYIEIVFDNYFTPDNVFTCYHENRLIASLLCVPYEFQNLAKGDKKRVERGMYLCGLATRPEYRRQGIMSQLMAEAEQSIKERGYSLAFLIPADSHLREYYRMKGYRDASFRRTKEISNSSMSNNPTLNIYSIHRLIDNGRLEFVEGLAEWCCNLERRDCHPRILHSKKDIIAVMAENENSIFLTSGAFDLENPILAKVVAVAFPEPQEDTMGEDKIVVAGLYVEDGEEHLREIGYDGSTIRKEVEKAIGRSYPGKRIELIEPYEGMQTTGKGEEPYAMIKYLNAIENSSRNENIIYKISLMLD